MGQVEALLKQQDVNDFLAFGRMRAHFYKHATLRTNIRAVVQESEVVGDAYRACAYLRRIACDSSAPLQYLWKWTNSNQVKADRGRHLRGKKAPDVTPRNAGGKNNGGKNGGCSSVEAIASSVDVTPHNANTGGGKNGGGKNDGSCTAESRTAIR